ncbi:MAG: hypothetical protein PUB52_02055 [Lachnospiraceae bacterium]|nr:hypothetical protein [Lachnospiraceae bacterium]
MGGLIVLVIGICVFNFVRVEVRSREEAEQRRNRKELEFQKQMEHTRKLIDDANKTIAEINKKRLSQEFPKSEVVAEQQYQKILGVVEAIDNEKENLQSDLTNISIDDELVRWDIIQRLQVLNDIERKIGSVLKESSGSAGIVDGLREELGDDWYKDWRNLVKDTNSIQRYVEGITYEIVFGQASAKDII